MENFEIVSKGRKILPQEVKNSNVVMLISLFSYLCFSLGIASLQETLGEQFSWLQSVAVSAVIGELGMILPAVVYLCCRKVNWKELLRVHKIKLSTVVLVVIFAYTIMPLMNFLSAVTMLFSKNVIADTIEQMAGSYSSGISLIVIALIPCLLEEFLYRGFMYGTYAKNNKRFGIFLSGLLFGLVHMNINQFAYAFVMGMIFAMLIEATESIWSSVIVHFCINGTSVIMQYITQGTAENVKDTEVLAAYTDKTIILMVAAVWAFIAIITTAIAILVYYVIAKNEGRVQNIKEIWTAKKGTKLTSLPLIITMIICVAFMWQISF